METVVFMVISNKILVYLLKEREIYAIIKIKGSRERAALPSAPPVRPFLLSGGLR